MVLSFCRFDQFFPHILGEALFKRCDIWRSIGDVDWVYIFEDSDYNIKSKIKSQKSKTQIKNQKYFIFDMYL